MKIFKDNLLTFNIKYFIVFITILLIEVGIATFLKGGFIRYTFGDFLSTILVYCFIRSFLTLKPIHTAIISLVIAFSIEFLQLINVLEILNIENKIVRIVLGTSFSIGDLIAYTLGVITAFLIDTSKSSS